MSRQHRKHPFGIDTRLDRWKLPPLAESVKTNWSMAAIGALVIVAGCLNPLPLPGADATNPPATPPATNQPTAPAAETPVEKALSEQDQERFFNWLLGLGADTNRVLQLRQNSDVTKFFTWFEEHGPGPAKVEQLLNGKDLGGFYTWLERDGVLWDRDRVFTVTNGILRISGQRIGYLATKKVYSDFRLVAEFKWGHLTWGKRKDRLRNSGLCIHGTGLDKVWMKSIEIQIAEGQTGDVVVLDGAKLTVDGVTKSRSFDTFKRPGEQENLVDKAGYRARDDLERPRGEWNTIEIISLGSVLRVKVNGKPVLDATSMLPNAGRILLQSNGAEIFFRRLDVHSLK